MQNFQGARTVMQVKVDDDCTVDVVLEISWGDQCVV